MNDPGCGEPAISGRVFSPGCGLPGCQHHYRCRPGRCECPAWFDSGGYHLIDVSPSCEAHETPAANNGPGTAHGALDGGPVNAERACGLGLS